MERFTPFREEKEPQFKGWPEVCLPDNVGGLAFQTEEGQYTKDGNVIKQRTRNSLELLG